MKENETIQEDLNEQKCEVNEDVAENNETQQPADV